MLLIRELVEKTLVSGCLTIETELKLGYLFKLSMDLEDVEVMMKLQQAISTGQIQRQKFVSRATRDNTTVNCR